jgi:hypothetical protein
MEKIMITAGFNDVNQLELASQKLISSGIMRDRIKYISSPISRFRGVHFHSKTKGPIYGFKAIPWGIGSGVVLYSFFLFLGSTKSFFATIGSINVNNFLLGVLATTFISMFIGHEIGKRLKFNIVDTQDKYPEEENIIISIETDAENNLEVLNTLNEFEVLNLHSAAASPVPRTAHTTEI